MQATSTAKEELRNQAPTEAKAPALESSNPGPPASPAEGQAVSIDENLEGQESGA